MNIKAVKTVLKKVYRLPFSNKATLLKAWLLALLIRLALKVWQYKTITKYLNGFCKNKTTANVGDGCVTMFHSLIKLSNELRTAMGVNCLHLSMAYLFLMKRRGLSAKIKFGVANPAGIFGAHAWLEYNGVPLTTDDLIGKKYFVMPDAVLV